MTADGAVVRSWREGDDIAVSKLLEQAFDVHHSADELKWRFERCPLPAVTRVLEVDGRVAGFVGMLPLSTSVGASDVMTGMPSHAAIAPSLRGRGFGGLLDADPDGARADIAFTVTFPLERTMPIMRNRRDTVYLGRVGHWVHWRTVAAVEYSARRPLGRWLRTALGVAFAARRALMALPTGVTVDPAPPTADELDALARRSRRFAHAIRIRDAAFVAWRWLDHGDWTVWTARDGRGRCRGYVAFGRDGGGRPRIVDLLVDRRRDAAALLRAAADELGRDGATRVVFDFHDPRRLSAVGLLAAGFVRRGVGPHMCVRALRPGFESVHDPRAWYVTSADGDRV